MAGLDHKYGKKFAGTFDALSKMGADYHNDQRFKALIGDGKPLWEFKEFDHRLFCHRHVADKRVDVFLLNGWIKDKRGRTDKEVREILTAQNLCVELKADADFQTVLTGGTL